MNFEKPKDIQELNTFFKELLNQQYIITERFYKNEIERIYSEFNKFFVENGFKVERQNKDFVILTISKNDIMAGEFKITQKYNNPIRIIFNNTQPNKINVIFSKIFLKDGNSEDFKSDIQDEKEKLESQIKHLQNLNYEVENNLVKVIYFKDTVEISSWENTLNELLFN